jgi:hypothetical protein
MEAKARTQVTTRRAQWALVPCRCAQFELLGTLLRVLEPELVLCFDPVL